MSEAIVPMDLATYTTIVRLLGELEEFKAKWPNDFKNRVGYVSKVERILDLLPSAFNLLPSLKKVTQ